MITRAIFFTLSCILSIIILSFPAYAAYAESRTWFNSLTDSQKSQLQANLILMGFYNGLIDGDFGQGTYSALTKFETKEGLYVDGVLSEDDLETLAIQANTFMNELGFQFIEDEKVQLGLMIPTKLLTAKTPIRQGNSYASQDKGITLETIKIPKSEKNFNDLFITLSQTSNSRKITYSRMLSRAFVVSGFLEGKSFYLIFFDEKNESIGFSILWTKEYQQIGNIISVFLASNVAPLSYLKEFEQQDTEKPPPTKKTPTKQPKRVEQSTQEQPSNGKEKRIKSFGAFVTFDEIPKIIGLRGPLDANSPLDFRRALKASPNAETIILNSDGGYVSSALIIAQDIYSKGMNTYIMEDQGCYSSCAFIFFAGKERRVDGELGVHQIWSETPNLNSAQLSLANILDVLNEFGVEQGVIAAMLRTPSEQIYVFTEQEVKRFSINVGEPINF